MRVDVAPAFRVADARPDCNTCHFTIASPLPARLASRIARTKHRTAGRVTDDPFEQLGRQVFGCLSALSPSNILASLASPSNASSLLRLRVTSIHACFPSRAGSELRFASSSAHQNARIRAAPTHRPASVTITRPLTRHASNMSSKSEHAFPHPPHSRLTTPPHCSRPTQTR